MATTNGSENGERPKSMKEALEVLDQALAGGGTDLRADLAGAVSDAKNAVKEQVTDATDRFRDFRQEAMDEALKRFQELSTQSSETMQRMLEDGREAALSVDRKIRENPWPIIGGVAIGTLALGFLLGRRGPETKLQP